jgi:hypothetical protein
MLLRPTTTIIYMYRVVVASLGFARQMKSPISLVVTVI